MFFNIIYHTKSLSVCRIVLAAEYLKGVHLFNFGIQVTRNGNGNSILITANKLI